MAIISKAFGIVRTSHIFEAQYDDTSFNAQHSRRILDGKKMDDNVQIHICNQLSTFNNSCTYSIPFQIIEEIRNLGRYKSSKKDVEIVSSFSK